MNSTSKPVFENTCLLWSLVYNDNFWMLINIEGAYSIVSCKLNVAKKKLNICVLMLWDVVGSNKKKWYLIFFVLNLNLLNFCFRVSFFFDF